MNDFKRVPNSGKPEADDEIFSPDFFKDLKIALFEDESTIVNRFLFGEGPKKVEKTIKHSDSFFDDDFLGTEKEEKKSEINDSGEEINKIIVSTKTEFIQTLEKAGGYFHEANGDIVSVGTIDDEILKCLQQNPPELLKEALANSSLSLSESGVRSIFESGETHTLTFIKQQEISEFFEVFYNLDVDFKPDLPDYSLGQLTIKNIDTGEKLTFYIEITDINGKIAISCLKDKGNGVALDINSRNNNIDDEYSVYCTKMFNAKTKKEALEFFEEMIVLGHYNKILASIFTINQNF